MSDIPKQLLHLVFGGELQSVAGIEFKDLDKLDIVGVYPNYASAYAAWKAKAQGSRRQCADALFHRAYAPPARARQQRAALRQRMQFWRRIGRQQWAKTALGVVAAEYVRFVGKTTRLTVEPPDAWDRAEADMPIITAFWHGQHLLATNASKPSYKVKMLVSRHHDGEVNAIAAERLGVGTIRGSGNHAGGFVHKGGAAAFQAMLDALAEGYSVALSADVPKVSRIAGLGIIKLAQISGRPIHALAIATHWRIVLDNWDHSTINLPFSRGAGVVPEPLRVAADADDAGLEAARQELENRLNAATRRAYEIVDQPQLR